VPIALHDNKSRPATLRVILLVVLLAPTMSFSNYSDQSKTFASAGQNQQVVQGTLVGISDKTTFSIEVEDSQYVQPRHGILVLIPPNAKVEKTDVLRGATKIISCQEFFFRDHKFAYIAFNEPTRSLLFNVTCSPDGPLLPYVEFDELSDPVLDQYALGKSSYWYNLTIWNLEKRSEWKAYPTYQVQKYDSTVLPEGNYQYVIIVPEGWFSVVSPLVEWKQKKGIQVFVATTEWVYSSYEGKDSAERIREFLKDAFNRWHMRYVLLAGGIHSIPTRLVWGYGQSTPLPLDLYYMCLDGNWDANNDQEYGEYFQPYTWVCECDPFPEFVLGRLPADKIGELNVMVNKILSYEQSPASGDWIYQYLGIDGEMCNGEPWGVTDPDEVCNQTWLVYGTNLTSTSDVTQYLNAGESFVFACTHGSPDSWYLGSGPDFFTFKDVLALGNDGKLPLVISDGCYTASFDSDECIGVAMLKNERGGAIAYVGYSTPGDSIVNAFIRQFFFKGYVNYGINGYKADFNETNSYARAGIAFYQGHSLECLLLWAQTFLDYTNLPFTCFFGDPEMSIWNTRPKTLDVKIPEKVLMGEKIVITITDANNGQPLPEVIVRILANNSWTELVTDKHGQVAWEAPSFPCNLQVRVCALFRNLPTESRQTIIVTEINPPVISFSGIIPREPTYGDAVVVSAIITDEGSGVKNATLYFSTDSWASVNISKAMTYDNRTGSWTSTIPEQPLGTTVKFYILAYDNAENRAKNDNQGSYYSYTTNRPITDYILYGAAGVIAIGLFAFFLRSRKKAKLAKSIIRDNLSRHLL